MKIKSLYGCEPPEFVRRDSHQKEDRVAFFRKFCDEQPAVIAFLTKYGTDYQQYQVWTALSIQLGQKLWWNYIGNGAVVPQVTMDSLELHYLDNKQFAAIESAAARKNGMKSVKEKCHLRPQPDLRLMVLATLFDATQSTMICAEDEKLEPELVRDQNHVHALLGAVLEAFDAVAVDMTALKKPDTNDRDPDQEI
jgi:hypothetical protein